MASPADEEDDYMTMVIPDVSTGKETSLQRRRRLQREAEQRSHQKTKKQKDAEERAAREAALSTALDSSNKGFKMMAKMGFKQGGTLGKSDEARKEPIHVSMKEDRSGIGHESEMKRKFREEAEEAVKRVKLEDEKKENYLEELKRDHLEQKLASQLENAQRVAETMDEDEVKDATDKLPAELKILQERHDSEPKEQGLSNINVLYRGLVQDRRKRELEKQNRLRDWNDGPLANFVVDEEDDDRDPELNEFNALPVDERLERVVLYLREKHRYCFWCMYKYPDAEMDGCPGTTEADHD